MANLTKMGPHFAAGIQQDAHEFLRSLTANMHLADLKVGGSPRPHIQQHATQHFWWTPAQPGALQIVPH